MNTAAQAGYLEQYGGAALTGTNSLFLCGSALSCLMLAGCSAMEATQQIPTQAQSIMATIEAPPDGEFDCGFPLGDTVFGRPRGIILAADGAFEFFHQDGQDESEVGQWDFAPDLHQIGFSGETSLDYGYYDIGARQLILFMKPAEDGQVFNLHCVRGEGESAGQP
jgi:hypothetical protein